MSSRPMASSGGSGQRLPATPRLLVWAGLGVAWIVGIVLAARSSRAGLGLTEQALADAERLSVVFHPLRLTLSGGAAAALAVGWLRPAPWLLALLLVAILSVVWFFAVSRFLRADAWGQPWPARSWAYVAGVDEAAATEQTPSTSGLTKPIGPSGPRSPIRPVGGGRSM